MIQGKICPKKYLKYYIYYKRVPLGLIKLYKALYLCVFSGDTPVYEIGKLPFRTANKTKKRRRFLNKIHILYLINVNLIWDSHLLQILPHKQNCVLHHTHKYLCTLNKKYQNISKNHKFVKIDKINPMSGHIQPLTGLYCLQGRKNAHRSLFKWRHSVAWMRFLLGKVYFTYSIFNSQY